MEKNKSFLGCAMLFLAAFLWGTTTVVQSMAAAADLPSFTYLAARSFVGAIALWAVVLLRQVLGRRSSKGVSVLPQSPSERKTALKGGILCGAVLTGAAYLQQQGIVFGASAGEVGFLTSLYMLFVPLFSFLLYRRKVSANVLFGAVSCWSVCIFSALWTPTGRPSISDISLKSAVRWHLPFTFWR